MGLILYNAKFVLVLLAILFMVAFICCVLGATIAREDGVVEKLMTMAGKMFGLLAISCVVFLYLL